MDMNDTGNRVIAGIVVVLIVIGAWYLGTTFKASSGKKTATTSTSTQNAPSTSSASASANANPQNVTVSGSAVSVKDQPAGSVVVVASATLPQMGWVAVRDADGKTLGAARLDAGTHEAVQVPLLRNTETGQKYQVLLYIDDGDKMFDLHKDTLVMNADGSVEGATFTALNGD
jgi:hypothetical protein